MSDSGFVDEAPSGRARPPRAPSDSQSSTDLPGIPADGGGTPPGAGRRRGGAIAAVFVLLVAALLGFAGWAWAGRVHAGDVAAYGALAQEVTVMDRTLTPLGHSEISPCRDSDGGRVTRTYPPTTGPQAAELVGHLQQQGWTPSPATPPTLLRLTRTEGDHVLTLDVVARTASSLAESITATSEASAFGCLGR